MKWLRTAWLEHESDYRRLDEAIRAALTAALDGMVVQGLTEQQIIECERYRCVHLCERWVATFKNIDIQYTSARDYAVDDINDSIDLIKDGQPLPTPPAAQGE